MSDKIVGGRYRLGKRIGSGGMGHVWLARDEVLRRHVAVKEILLPDGLSDSELKELRLRTLREARTAARLDHPNVVRIYDVIYAEDRPWIVMEYVPSRSLAQTVKEYGPLTPERAARMGIALLAALRAAHQAGVLHRDVKPGNVLLGDDGRVVLTDFGLATFDEVGAPLTQSGVVHGSPQFIAPERALDGTSSAAADMWSLGATIYAAVEGHSPYSRSSSYAVLTALATTDPDPPQQAGKLAPVLMGLLTRDPDARMKPDDVRDRLVKIAATDAGRGWFIRRPRRGEPHVPSHAVPKLVSTPRDRDDPVPSVRRVPTAVTVSRSAPARELHIEGPARIIQSRNHDRRRWLGPVTFLALAVLVLSGVFLRYEVTGTTASPATQPPGGPGVGIGTPPPTRAPNPQGRPNPPPGGPPATLSWQCRPDAPPVTNLVPSTTVPAGVSKPPKGWVSYLGSTGYRLAVPNQWRVATDDNTVCFYDLGRQRVLGFNQWAVTTTDPVAALQAREVELKDAGSLPRYQVDTIVSVTCAKRCAEWEYTWDGPLGPLHTRMWAYLGPGHQAYAITWTTPESAWPANLINYGYAIAGFHPPAA